MPKKVNKTNLVSLTLRLGLAFVFLYAAISSLRQPVVWAVYIPNFATHIASAVTLIRVISIYEIVLAAWLLIGKYTKYAAILSGLTLLSIITANPHQFSTTFRDVGLVFMAVALFFQDINENR